jgi:hypothetical protein
MVLTRDAADCDECVLLKDKLAMSGVWCWRHHPDLDDRDKLVLEAFVDALLARRAAHGGLGVGGESLMHSIHVVKRRFMGKGGVGA